MHIKSYTNIHTRSHMQDTASNLLSGSDHSGVFADLFCCACLCNQCLANHAALSWRCSTARVSRSSGQLPVRGSATASYEATRYTSSPSRRGYVSLVLYHRCQMYVQFAQSWYFEICINTWYYVNPCIVFLCCCLWSVVEVIYWSILPAGFGGDLSRKGKALHYPWWERHVIHRHRPGAWHSVSGEIVFTDWRVPRTRSVR